MKYFVLLSQCLEIHSKFYLFHFKGAFKGELVKEIRVIRNINSIELNQEYLILAKFNRFQRNVLWAEAIKVKNISDLRYQI